MERKNLFYHKCVCFITNAREACVCEQFDDGPRRSHIEIVNSVMTNSEDNDQFWYKTMIVSRGKVPYGMCEQRRPRSG